MKAVVNNFKKMISRQNGIFNSKKGQDALIRLQFDLSQVTMSVYGQKEMLVLSAECETDEPFDVVFMRNNLPKVDTKIADFVIKVENHRLFFNDVEIDFALYSEQVYKYPKSIDDRDTWTERCSIDSDEVLAAFKASYPTRMQDDALEKLMGFKVDPGRKKIYTIDGYRATIYDCVDCQYVSGEPFTIPDYTYKSLKSIVGKSNQQLIFQTIPGDIVAICGDDFTYYATSQYKNDESTLSLFNTVIGFFNENNVYSGKINYDTLVNLDREYKLAKKTAAKDDDKHYCAISNHYNDLYISHYFAKKYSASTYSPHLVEGYTDRDLIHKDYIIYFNMRYISEVINVLDNREDILLYLPEKEYRQAVIKSGKMEVMVLPVRMSNYIYDRNCIERVIKDGEKLKDAV